jgi:PAS domain S-box-containing protein
MSDPAATVRVLHVDDDPAFLDTAATFLEREGASYSVETATAVDEALDRIEEGVDCVVSDYELPSVDGIAFLETVRADDPDLPFILFTGRGSEAVASEAISAGVTDYIQKGIGTEQYELLCQRIENAVTKRRAQTNYRELFEKTPVGLTMHDPDTGEIIDANQSFGELLGYDPAELEGSHPGDLSPAGSPFDRSRANRLIEATVQTGSQRFEWQDQTRDGEPVWVEVTLERATIDGRQRVLAAVQETTERKRHQQTIESLHNTATDVLRAETPAAVATVVIHAMQETLGLPATAVWLFDESEDVLRPVEWSDSAEEVVGEPPTFRPGEALAWEVFEQGEGRRYDDVSTETDRYNPETSLRSELILPLGDHGVVAAGSTEVGVFDDVDGSLASIVTSHAETALDRLEQERTLKREHERFRALFEMLPEPVTHARFEDDEPVVQDVNPAFEDTFGYDRESIIGRSINDVVVPEDRQAEAATIDSQIITAGKIREEIRRQTADGVRDFLLTSAPVRNDERVEEVFGIAIDISEQKDYERQLERQNERLAEFAKIVSHDLRNPLNVARGHLELARPDCEPSHLDAVAGAHERMETLIADLLTVTSEGQSVTDREPIHLATLAERSWANVDTAAATLVTDTDRVVRGDRSRLQQLLENLVRNAVEHGGEAVTVTIGDLGDATGFFVADDGPGIPAGTRDDVFEMGYTSSSNGTGFGLSIVKEVVEAHDWELTVTDSEAGGARFEISGVAPSGSDE